MFDGFWLVHPDDGDGRGRLGRFAGLPNVRVLRCRFEDLEPHDCFVTAGNAFGLYDRRHRRGGGAFFFGAALMEQVQHQVMDRLLGEQPVGTAFLVPTGHPRLPSSLMPDDGVPGGMKRRGQGLQRDLGRPLAVHAHNAGGGADEVEVVALPALGAGFGGVPFSDEAARADGRGLRHYLEPPHRLDWDFVTERQLAICYDGKRTSRAVRQLPPNKLLQTGAAKRLMAECVPAPYGKGTATLVNTRVPNAFEFAHPRPLR